MVNIAICRRYVDFPDYQKIDSDKSGRVLRAYHVRASDDVEIASFCCKRIVL